MAPKPTAISGLLVMALAGYVGHQMIYRTYQRQRQALQARMADQQQAQTLRTQAARAIEEIEQFRKRLPAEPEPEWLVREVNRLADETHIQLTTIAPTPPRALEGLDGCMTLTITVHFAASYRQLDTFVSALEHAPVFLRVDELTLTRSGEGTANIQLTISTVYVPSLSIQSLRG